MKNRRSRTVTVSNTVVEDGQTSLDSTCDLLRLRVSQLSTPPQIHGYDQEKRQVMDLIRRTSTTGESNSALLIGPRGCGKSMLIDNVVEELMTNQEIKDNLLQVRLNGLLQTDDKIALKEITRQLQLENTVGNKVFIDYEAEEFSESPTVRGRGRGSRARGRGGRGRARGRPRGRGGVSRGRSRGRGSQRGRGGSRLHADDRRRVEERREQRKAKAQELVRNMSAERLRDIVTQMVEREPGLVFDLCEVPGGSPPGDPPAGEPSQTPSWCKCNHCREMPTDIERKCCDCLPNNCIANRPGSFAENLQFLLEALKSGSHSSKPILFVLDEFDLFAHHKNQTLLYNLFDVAQSAQAPVCVIGLTCRLDVVELLEKRVKSRFSHRQVHLFNNITLGDYTNLFISYLSLPDNFTDSKFVKTWNQHIQELASDQTVQGVLRRQFEFNKDVRTLQQLLTYPVCCVNEDHPFLVPADFVDGMKMQSTDTKSAMLHGVSILELCLIIAMMHLTEIYDGEPFNFEMVYSEYRKFAQRRSSMQVYEKAVVLKAFEHLIALELVKTTDGAGSRVQKEYRLLSLLIHPSQILDALQKYPHCPTEVKQWAQSSVI